MRTTYLVVRNCCTSGMCIDCQGRRGAAFRVEHGKYTNKQLAERVARNWSGYGATVQKIGGAA